MTVWVCYVAVLWMADPSLSPWPHASLLVSLLAIALSTPYMIYRTTQQKSVAAMFRYSVSGAVVSWSGIEIASATGMFSEPWLSTSLQSLLLYTVAPMVLLGLAIVALRHPDRSTHAGDDTQEKLSRRANPIRQQPLITSVLLLSIGWSIAGCGHPETPEEPLTSQQIIERLEQIEASVQAVPAEAMGGIMHALASPDREARLSAIASCGKSKSISPQLKNMFLEIAETDPDPLIRGAALRTLYRLGRPSAALRRLVTQLADDPLLGELAGQLK
ncbi:MAG: HEAT repeat domain-containing protein [Novipirellula sp. JB048]